MPKFQDICHMHEESVMKVTQHKKPRTRGKVTPVRITTNKVHPLLKQWLDSHGYKVSDPRVEKKPGGDEVIIHNNPPK